ncbi:MAG: hypothetical protein F6K18_04620 [Okeania sp. SIO2C2]|uniref:peptidoglycan recognition protein family protein n=1 Tax=Okeania sp. SIO2C2 TaxID=2607787 RepID=UPI0013BC3F53|nr:N-acetylmuramoyl-L-alanine amidase [Okeania sp. SIO2C2]NEP86158.1 hypothetical protein [Okeania sp. SIO2C2]
MYFKVNDELGLGYLSATIDIAKSVDRNQGYMIDLGWQKYIDEIVSLLGFTSFTPNEEIFAQAVADWQEKWNLKPDGIIGPKTWQLMQDKLNLNLDVIKTDRIKDRTALTPKDKRKNLKRGLVYALVLHQMAFSRGNDVRKYNNVTAHFIITPDGQIAQLHPISAYLYASNGFNKHSVAVEFAGNLPSVKGRCWKTENFGCHRLTSAQIEAGRYLVRTLINKIGLTHILAHRQSSRSRSNDPGPDIWYYIGQWAVNNLGLKDGGSGFKIGNGKPIPDSWREWGKL